VETLTFDRAAAPVRVRADWRVIPWYLWSVAAAVTLAYVGLYWDISWHRSIGRDTFWTPPHLAIYACGALAGIAAGYLILSPTSDPASPLRDVSVRVWRLRGPIGAFLCGWGGVAMLTSAPFDDWWHSAYGLDVRILSPPHVVLASGFFAVKFGAILLILSFVNRASGAARAALQRLLLYAGGVALAESLLLHLEQIERSLMHTPFFYGVAINATVGILAAIGIASRHRWACTVMAAIYTAFNLVFLWVLPLFPAEPKLGPVYQRVTHFIPWEFPLLILVPAWALDVTLRRTGAWSVFRRAIVVGLVFFAAFIVVQWPFADFLMSPLARNRFFGAHYMDFSTPAFSRYARFQFNEPDASAAVFGGKMAVVALVSFGTAWVGLLVGGWMMRLKR
jgi:hypothetical protein